MFIASLLLPFGRWRAERFKDRLFKHNNTNETMLSDAYIVVRGVEWKVLITSRMQAHPTTRQNTQYLGVFVQCNGNCKDTFVPGINCFVEWLLRVHASDCIGGSVQRVDMSRPGGDSAAPAASVHRAAVRLRVSRAVRGRQRRLHPPPREPHLQPQRERLGLLYVHCPTSERIASSSSLLLHFTSIFTSLTCLFSSHKGAD